MNMSLKSMIYLSMITSKGCKRSRWIFEHYVMSNTKHMFIYDIGENYQVFNRTLKWKIKEIFYGQKNHLVIEK